MKDEYHDDRDYFNPNPAHHEPLDYAVLTSQEAQIAVEEEREIERKRAPAHGLAFEKGLSMQRRQDTLCQIATISELAAIKAEYVSWSWWGYDADGTNFVGRGSRVESSVPTTQRVASPPHKG
ncbi:hypothetical protein BDZ91DRAFT_798460 [Kalaharituber pfeilii]|nr:hypothetical protein BDZ91DRAFT_798460 [Kalaharituber pfeilii]